MYFHLFPFLMITHSLVSFTICMTLLNKCSSCQPCHLHTNVEPFGEFTLQLPFRLQRSTVKLAAVHEFSFVPVNNFNLLFFPTTQCGGKCDLASTFFSVHHSTVQLLQFTQNPYNVHFLGKDCFKSCHNTGDSTLSSHQICYMQCNWCSSLLGVFCLCHHFYILLLFFPQGCELLELFISDFIVSSRRTYQLPDYCLPTNVNQNGQMISMHLFMLLVTFVCNLHLLRTPMLFMWQALIVKILYENQDLILYLLVLSMPYTL